MPLTSWFAKLPSSEQMKVIILGGFLGSGKTTLLLQLAPFLAAGSQKDPAVVVLENEISVTDVDTKLLKSRNLTVQNMAAGCICCTSSAALPISVGSIQNEYDPDYLIIEATGMAYPDVIAKMLETELNIQAKIAVLADATRWKKLQIAMPGFVNGQLNMANVVFLNKIDLVSPECLPDLCTQISSQTNAPVYPVSVSKLLDPALLDLLH